MFRPESFLQWPHTVMKISDIAAGSAAKRMRMAQLEPGW